MHLLGCWGCVISRAWLVQLNSLSRPGTRGSLRERGQVDLPRLYPTAPFGQAKASHRAGLVEIQSGLGQQGAGTSAVSSRFPEGAGQCEAGTAGLLREMEV